MQLDKTRIAIRERSLPELLDLTLVVGRRHFWPLVGWWLVGVAPWAGLNYWLLVVAGEGFSEHDLVDPDRVMSFLYFQTLLTVLEVPWATAPLTLYLGQALFDPRPRSRQILTDWLRALPQLLWFQGLWRVVLVVPVITAILPYVAWPYLNEVTLLERNPLWSTKRTGTTTWRRSRNLHGRSSGELFGRWVAAALCGAWLTGGLWFAGLVLKSYVLNIDWEFDVTTFTLWYPAALWGAAGFLAVLRFLSYLDLRIRHEGWEIELRMRAEATRLERRVA